MLSLVGKAEVYVRVVSWLKCAWALVGNVPRLTLQARTGWLAPIPARLPSQTGKVYLTNSFICFTSLDRRSCRTSLALCTVRRVEKLPPGVGGGAVALSIGLWEGGKIILGLNGLRGSCDQASAVAVVHLLFQPG